MDRFPTGVVILDGEARCSLSNRAAQRIAGSEDGVRFGDGRLRLTSTSDDAVFRRFVEQAVGVRPGFPHGQHDAIFAIPRPSRMRAFP